MKNTCELQRLTRSPKKKLDNNGSDIWGMFGSDNVKLTNDR